MQQMETYKGYIEHIRFRNTENGYTVFDLACEQGECTCVGIFHFINEGEYLEVRGEFRENNSYGMQFYVDNYEVITPKDEVSMIRYLGSGAIKGMKEATAKKIVDKFKEDTFRIIEEEPERLAEIKGISLKKAMEISEQVENMKEARNAMIFLAGYGINMTLASKIYNFYGPNLYQIVKTNPYRLADDIEGVGFRIADDIARHVGIAEDSDFRIYSGIQYTLVSAVTNGHVYLPKEELLDKARVLLGIYELDLDKYLVDLAIDKKIIVKSVDDVSQVYATQLFYCELNIARKMCDLNISCDVDESRIQKKLKQISDQEGIVLDELQEQAVKEAIRCGTLIITGGPGTGKTTTINAIIKFFESEDMDILLAAPTGRAAKRMKEATGYEAVTIHRLLELNGNPEETNQGFARNEDNPLEADIIIVDEMSMVDIFLMQSLLRAVTVGTRLILVGDVNQLPSVGPGNVLRDLIESEVFPVVCLTKIFRQATTSDIVMNAHKINAGEKVDLGKRSNDFLFIRGKDAKEIVNTILVLLRQKLPNYVGADMNEIQVMTPSRKGLLGVETLNQVLQERLNPKSPTKIEKEFGTVIFREGDKVMQIKNDYEIDWELKNQYKVTYEHGKGVFNGDCGIINRINLTTEYVEVIFDDNKYVTYTFKQLEELELAYAITIHKSQGSEYPAVIMPMYPAPKMLMNRNLLYTAVTRAKQCVCLVGLPGSFETMLYNKNEQLRYSGLKDRICEVEKSDRR